MIPAVASMENTLDWMRSLGSICLVSWLLTQCLTSTNDIV